MARKLDIQPKRFGLRYDPPVIVLEYLVPSTGKLFHHRMRVRGLTRDANSLELAELLRFRHPNFLHQDLVALNQVVRLVDKMKEHLFGATSTSSGAKTDTKSGNILSSKIDINQYDLNKVTEAELAAHKAKMQQTFELHKKRPGDPGFVYDVQREFDPEEPSGWDEEEEEDSYEASI
eukprot:GILJ01009158.1.p1 GENE.GILJ01009158.1~~GILJ01009158.1.p1  ORF type:complete len:177 (+),score=22.08 GILJ01009158.1:59-589(+)